MPGVKVEDIGRLAVEDKPDGKFVLEHLTRDVISVAQLVTKAVTPSIQKKTALATES
jgi:hypothetical protein